MPFLEAATTLMILALIAQQSTNSPYPPSPVIANIEFAPLSTVIRQAVDSDNWPITWADDDYLYTSYGDGTGFQPGGRKLSQGFARVEGLPPDFTGVNIPSPTGERLGDGARGPKASGMVCVDGILYLWVRNLANSQLAWSEDHAKTWHWCDWKFQTSFGCPTFLNFGKNYEGARDNYVYTYSQDGDTAYQPYDQVVLARAPKNRLRDRTAYEFFVKLDAAANPVWTTDINQRGPVLQNPGRCYRMDVVYHPGLKRYLLIHSFGQQQGMAIFDAPEPWGPWTTAVYTDAPSPAWDLTTIHSFRIPTKWIDLRDNSFWLLFSGRSHQNVNYDAFCLRKAVITVRNTNSQPGGP